MSTETRPQRITKLLELRNRVDEEIRSLIPRAQARTAEEWLLLLPTDPDAAQHRRDLDAEVGGRAVLHREAC